MGFIGLRLGIPQLAAMTSAAPPVSGFAHLSVRFTQDYSLEWASGGGTGSLPDAPIMLMQIRMRGNGSYVAGTNVDNRGIFNKVPSGSNTLDGTHSAEQPQGMMFVNDNSAGNNGGGVFRSAVGDTGILTNGGFLTAFAPTTPKNMEYVDYVIAVRVDLSNGNKLGAIAIDGVQKALFVEGGNWGSGTVSNSVGKTMLNVFKAASQGAADFDCARFLMTRLSSATGVLDPDHTKGFDSAFLAKVFTPGTGAVDLGTSGIISGVSTPNTGNAPDIFLEVRPGGAAADMETNRGLLGNPSRSAGSGSVNSALKAPYLTSIHPEEKTGDQPFVAWLSTLQLGTANGSRALINGGQEIRVGDLILPWFAGSGGTGARAALACASPNGSYTLIQGTTTGDDFSIWGRTATSADVVANGKDWNAVNTNAIPTVTWTPSGAANCVSGVIVIRKPSGNPITVTSVAPVKQTFAIATPPTAAAITPPNANPALLMDFLKPFGWQFEGDLTPASGMIPSWKRAGDVGNPASTYQDAWAYMFEKRVASASAISARPYPTTVNGNPGVIISAVFS